MSEEPEADTGKENKPLDRWMPALKAVLALIAVLVILFVFYVAWDFSSYYFWDFLDMWTNSMMEHPLYEALFSLMFGIVLLVLAGLLVGGGDWRETFLDRLQLKPDARKKAGFALGTMIGAATAIAISVVTTLMLACLFGVRFSVGLQPDLLATAVLLAIPMLIGSVGEVILIQGFFQRKLTDTYDIFVGVIAAALIYMVLEAFPYHIYWLFEPQYKADIFFTGIIIAYLFYRSKSVFMPIGFLFARNLFSYVFNAFVGVSWVGERLDFHGVPDYLAVYFIRLIIIFMALVFVWYFENKTQDELKQTLDRIKSVADVFLTRITRDEK
jgi:membrane protease YdiL (CAAX protease family)